LSHVCLCAVRFDGYAVSLKKGDFTTPSVDPFFQKENGGLKYDISKPPIDFSTQNRH